ncbi:sugar ABC transporter substrate-binding protein [Salipiger aestuarii]|uniref:Probable sugar-binding periplasmic protein n=1 Tax=Salipiger aestuarii TaxID=568098 RepID=A0A327XYI4_9RHOB|nr:ABC transporter substrate-binding protein [Salipiger aestuarii]EIE52382.1 extracellular solute-binding protein [Citreicella sp. 357]KAA8605459.1 sugar ABC transporter substrate-binding protein [Salipiger aestuarii]KAB2539345.1 sugar ABC transporter substrate-binding protein [Salipiger aestuarii]RAK14038.1 glucose/mannose transport system substrate-binding protein [Salipiger aestuarii]
MALVKTARLLATVAVCGLATGASAADVEVLHWWTAGGEAAALNVLKEDLAGQDVGWEDMPVAGGGGSAATTTLKARVAAGNPPTAAQLLGMSVREWAQEGSLGDISDLATDGNWADVLPQAVVDFATYDDKWVAAPVNIHRPNWLWINAAIFEENGLTPPTSWDEFNEVATALQEKGITPLAHGGQPWQDATVFDDVVLGIGGPDFYRKAIIEADMDALGSDTMVQVFDQMRTLRGFVDDNFSGRDWNLATAMVLNGEAAMQLMGDWAKGEIIRADMTPGEDILCVAAPGTEGSYLFNTDFFAFFDVDEDQKSAQEAMASSVMSPEFQHAFNMVKGSIPPRTDVDISDFDACALKAKDDLTEANANGSLLGSLAHGHGQTSSVQQAIFDVVTEHFNSDMSSRDAVEELQLAVESASF